MTPPPIFMTSLESSPLDATLSKNSPESIYPTNPSYFSKIKGFILFDIIPPTSLNQFSSFTVCLPTSSFPRASKWNWVEWHSHPSRAAETTQILVARESPTTRVQLLQILRRLWPEDPKALSTGVLVFLCSSAFSLVSTTKSLTFKIGKFNYWFFSRCLRHEKRCLAQHTLPAFLLAPLALSILIHPLHSGLLRDTHLTPLLMSWCRPTNFLFLHIIVC